MDFVFIHAADIHLDSPLMGLERYEGAPVDHVRGATRRAFQNLVNLALETGVDFLLLAGDLYDGDWRDYNTGLFFVSQMARLQEAGIQVFLIRGNHDAASQITRQLKLPENVTLLSTEKPETVCLEDLGVAVHGQSFPTRAVTEDLSRNYPQACTGYFNIGLLHTCLNGREGHEDYAPCSLQYLANKGYQYWGLGHIHNRELLHTHPCINIPGNIQGRHIRERGEKGASLVRVKGGAVESVAFKALDVMRWSLVTIDASTFTTPGEVLDEAKTVLEEKLDKSQGRLLAVRFLISGSSPVHSRLVNEQDSFSQELRSLAVQLGLHSLWVEKVKIMTSPPIDSHTVLESYPVAFLLQYIDAYGEDTDLLVELGRELKEELNNLPPELFQGEMQLHDPAFLRRLLSEAQELILSHLLKKEDRAP